MALGPFDPWDLSLPDWEYRIRNGLSLIPNLPHLDLDRKTRSSEIYRALRLPDVTGNPTFGEAGAAWAEEMVSTFHAGLIDRPGLPPIRMMRELFLLISKKNGKSATAAALMLTELLLNERPWAEFILVGATQAIADIAFDAIRGMIDADESGYMPGIGAKRGRFHITATKKLVTDRLNNATLRVRTFDKNILTGRKPAGVLVDELHLTSDMPDAMKIIAQLRGGMVSQPEAFLIFITTQSDKPPAGAFKDELKKARRIRDGEDRATPMLPLLYEFPSEVMVETDRGKELWRDPKYWPMVMPNLGKSLFLDRMVQEFQTQVETSEEAALVWATQHLNLQLGIKQSSTSWAGTPYWPQAGLEPGLTVESLVERCDVIIPGLDGGGLDDLFGMSLLGREKGTGHWLHWCHAWAHDVVKDRRKEIVPHLEDFEKEKTLTFVDDLEKAYDEAVAIILQVYQAGLLHLVAVDRAGLALLKAKLAQAGVPDKFQAGGVEFTSRLAGIQQNFMLAGPIKATEVKIENKTLRHQGTQLMAWCVGNARVVERQNAVFIDKEVSGRAKIDPLMALFDSVTIMATNPASPLPLLMESPLEAIDLW